MPGALVTFHAHPDDESIATGGVMAQAAAAGRRVVLVVATKGESGEVPDGLLGPGERLEDRRVEETLRAAEILGAHRVEFLGYRDSGMAGTPENDDPGCFWRADLDAAAAQVAAILREEDAEVLTVYDERGIYEHPDHIQVHRVGILAAALAGTPRVYESTVNRDEVQRLMDERLAAAIEQGVDLPGGLPDPEDVTLGVPAHQINTEVDVEEFAALKRAALAEHASQVDESSFFLAMPPEDFRAVFGREWFIRRDAPPGTFDRSLFPTAE